MYILVGVSEVPRLLSTHSPIFCIFPNMDAARLKKGHFAISCVESDEDKLLEYILYVSEKTYQVLI